MSDLISRQAAIDTLRDARHRFFVADEAGGMGTVKWSEDVIYFAAAKRALADLPPVQPDHVADIGKKVEGDCISRKAAIDEVSKMMHECFGADEEELDAIEVTLHEIPAVQPETATVTIGRTRGGVTMWYECDACGEPIDQKDCYCRNCGRKLIYE